MNIATYFKRVGVGYSLMRLSIFCICIFLTNLITIILSYTANEMQLTISFAMVIAVTIVLFVLGYSVSAKKLKQEKAISEQRFRSDIYESMITNRLHFQTTGEMEVRLTEDLCTLSDFYSETMPAFWTGLITFSVCALLIIRISISLGCVFIGMSLLQMFPVSLYENWAEKIYEETDIQQEKYDNWLIQGYRGYQILKSFQQFLWYLSKFETIEKKMISLGKRAEGAGAVETAVWTGIDLILRYGVYILIGIWIVKGWVSAETSPQLIILSAYLFSSTEAIVSSFRARGSYRTAKKHFLFSTAENWKCIDMGNDCLIARIENISFRYDENDVISHFSAAIERNKMIELSGPNGSGKSTFFEILAGFLQVDQGTISILTDREKLFIVPQYDMDLPFSVDEYIQVLQKNHSADMGIFLNNLESFGLNHFLKDDLGQLSVGQRKMFFLATAFSIKDGFLMLDEPFNHLDDHAKQILVILMKNYHGTILYSLHGHMKALNPEQRIVLGEKENEEYTVG